MNILNTIVTEPQKEILDFRVNWMKSETALEIIWIVYGYPNLSISPILIYQIMVKNNTLYSDISPEILQKIPAYLLQEICMQVWLIFLEGNDEEKKITGQEWWCILLNEISSLETVNTKVSSRSSTLFLKYKSEIKKIIENPTKILLSSLKSILKNDLNNSYNLWLICEIVRHSKWNQEILQLLKRHWIETFKKMDWDFGWENWLVLNINWYMYVEFFWAIILKNKLHSTNWKQYYWPFERSDWITLLLELHGDTYSFLRLELADNSQTAEKHDYGLVEWNFWYDIVNFSKWEYHQLNGIVPNKMQGGIIRLFLNLSPLTYIDYDGDEFSELKVVWNKDRINN